MAQLLQDLITDAARQWPAALALRYADSSLSYAELAQGVAAAAQGWLRLGLQRSERVAVFLEKREEAVLAMFGAAAAGLAFVPINPLLKPDQVAHIVRDSGAAALLTTPARLSVLDQALSGCVALRAIVQTGGDAPVDALVAGLAPVYRWDAWMGALAQPALAPHRCIETDMAALLYTSGASGAPRGVVLSHRNLVAGAASLAECVGNTARDRILALLPFSCDVGLGQLTSAFASGAAVILMNHLLTRDIPDMVERERISGVAATPALWIQLAQLDWSGRPPLRYLSSSGGAVPPALLDALRGALPGTRIHLMYGQTEAMRATCLPPDQLAVRPESIGKAMPHAEVLVLAPDGRRCAPGEAGELVQRGPLVALGYWNDPARSAECFRPLPPGPGLPLPEMALWTGDTVSMDEQGYLYFIGRRDDLIKTGGYRVSPTEIEDVVRATGLVAEAAAFGVPHPVQGQAVALAATAHAGCELAPSVLLAACRAKLPAYMLPALVTLHAGALPRGPNGAIDRRLLAAQAARPCAPALP